MLLAELINSGEEIAASELVRFELLAGVRKANRALEASFLGSGVDLQTWIGGRLPVDTGPATCGIPMTWIT